jgi:hypothetical protein
MSPRSRRSGPPSPSLPPPRGKGGEPLAGEWSRRLQTLALQSISRRVDHLPASGSPPFPRGGEGRGRGPAPRHRARLRRADVAAPGRGPRGGAGASAGRQPLPRGGSGLSHHLRDLRAERATVAAGHGVEPPGAAGAREPRAALHGRLHDVRRGGRADDHGLQRGVHRRGPAPRAVHHPERRGGRPRDRAGRGPSRAAHGGGGSAQPQRAADAAADAAAGVPELSAHAGLPGLSAGATARARVPGPGRSARGTAHGRGARPQRASFARWSTTRSPTWASPFSTARGPTSRPTTRAASPSRSPP